MSTFDVNTFLDTQYTEATSTISIPVPEDDYQGQIDKVDIRQVKRADGSIAFIMEITWNVLGDKAITATNRDKPQSRQSLWLDLNEAGNIDMRPGLNIKLGKLREAVGLNDSTKPWSPRMLVGMTAWIHCTIETDEKDAERQFSRVTLTSRTPFTPEGTATTTPPRKVRAG